MKTQTKVETHAKKIEKKIGKGKAATQTVASMGVSDYARQGDLYIRKLLSVPSSAKLVEKPLRQLAPGTSMGSRHCISMESMEGMKIYDDSRNPLCGPVIESPRPFEIEHPEHGNLILPAGIYRVTYQRQANPAGDLRRVVD